MFPLHFVATVFQTLVHKPLRPNALFSGCIVCCLIILVNQKRSFKSTMYTCLRFKCHFVRSPWKRVRYNARFGKLSPLYTCHFCSVRRLPPLRVQNSRNRSKGRRGHQLASTHTAIRAPPNVEDRSNTVGSSQEEMEQRHPGNDEQTATPYVCHQNWYVISRHTSRLFVNVGQEDTTAFSPTFEIKARSGYSSISSL